VYKFRVMIAAHLFVMDAIGVTNSRPITKYECAIDVMHFIVGAVTRWINVRIVVKSFVIRVQH